MNTGLRAAAFRQLLLDFTGFVFVVSAMQQAELVSKCHFFNLGLCHYS